jgi:hypothetical protein
MSPVIHRLTRALALVGATLGAASAAAADGPQRGGTNLNPYWQYGPAAIVAFNPSSGHVQGGAVNVTKARTAAFLNGPVLKLCQPRFNGNGWASGSFKLHLRLTDAGREAVEPILAVKLEAKSSETGFPITNIFNYATDDIIEDEWFVSNHSIEIPASATNVCLSVYVYPATILAAGQTNPYIEALYVSSARIAMNSSVPQEDTP